MSLLAGPAALALLVAGRAPLEATMLRHMLVQLPLLVACGVLLRPWLARLPARRRRLADGDAHGLAGLTAAMFVTAYWMIPRALEQSLVHAPAEVLKFASLLALGVVLPASLRRAHLVVQLFFVANACAMMALAGMLYQDMPERLCNAYLIGDQAATGQALVWFALLLAGAWCALWYRRAARTGT